MPSFHSSVAEETAWVNGEGSCDCRMAGFACCGCDWD